MYIYVPPPRSDREYVSWKEATLFQKILYVFVYAGAGLSVGVLIFGLFGGFNR